MSKKQIGINILAVIGDDFTTKVQKKQFACYRNKFMIKGVEYKYEKNNGIPIIMSHAFLMNQKIMKKYAIALAIEGYVVYTYDFCGGAIFGKSDGKFSDMSIDTEKEDLTTIINYVKSKNYIDITKLILFGASQGGFISCLIAAQYQEKINKLILIYPALCIPDDARKGKMQMIEFDPNNIRETMKSKIFKFSAKYPESAINIDIFKEIQKISCPLFIVHGNKDKIVDMKYAQKALEASKNASSDLVILENARHGFNHRQFKEAINLIIEYLKK